MRRSVKRLTTPRGLLVLGALVAVTAFCGAPGALPRARSQAHLHAQLADVVRIRAGSFHRGASERELREAFQLCLVSTRFGAGNQLRCSEQLFELEAPRRTIQLSAYGIDRTEVSHARYRRCVSSGACLPAGVSADDPRVGQPEMPVSGVSYTDAEQYCAFVGGRLPTESEWERAAAGPSGRRRFPWGRQYNGRLANHGDDGRPDASDGHRYAAPVDAFPNGQSADGLLNMAGNVWEWTADRFDYDNYGNGPSVNPRGARSGGQRVVRGGSWRSDAYSLRVTHRVPVGEGARFPDLGFRCAYDVPAEPEDAR
ncbi:MAG: SUMF1/EgtB/PvdO family nonheme iron enzyme [Myxococcales bacterium]|nr:SUMF1/EgtB/PvdO family nonheme iron enzyme [Myxococcales bacterium]